MHIKHGKSHLQDGNAPLTLFTIENVSIRQEKHMHEKYVLVEHITSSLYTSKQYNFIFVIMRSDSFIFSFHRPSWLIFLRGQNLMCLNILMATQDSLLPGARIVTRVRV